MEMIYSNKDFFDTDEEIRAFFCSTHTKLQIHSHDFWEIAYIYEGTALLHTKTGRKKLSPGQFVLIKPGTEHSFTLPEESSKSSMWLCACIFTPNFYKDIVGDYLSIRELSCYSLYNMLNTPDTFIIQLSDDNAQNIKHLLWMIAHEYNHHTVGSNIIIKHALTDLFIYITRMYEYETTSLSGVVSKSHEIDELAKYIRSNFSYDLSLDFLAQHMNLSREYLCRYFKKHMGKTISEYLLEIRIEKAKQMLKTTTHSITDICEYCGYSSISNFQKAFKRVTGVSPSSYRKQNFS